MSRKWITSLPPAQTFPGRDALHTSFLPGGNLTADYTINEIQWPDQERKFPLPGSPMQRPKKVINGKPTENLGE
jgi:hypothetical protein